MCSPSLHPTSIERHRMSKWRNTGVSKLRRIPVLAHLPWKGVRKTTKHASSHLRIAITTIRKTWSARSVGWKSEATVTRSKVILSMMLTSPGTTTNTAWSRKLRPSTLRLCTPRPGNAPLNKRYMYAMRWAVHVPVVQLVLVPLISLPSKTKLNQVTIPMAMLAMIPHLSWEVVGSLSCCGSLWWASCS